jgi:hypothetical protein
MVRRRYYQDYSQIKHRITNLRAFLSQKHRGFVRRVREIYGEEYPLTRMAWWFAQHVGQLKLTLVERLNKAERMLEARRLTKERIERIKRYLEETEELVRRLATLSERFYLMVREAYEYERQVVAQIVRLLQGKAIDYTQLPRDVVVAMEYYLDYMTKRSGVVAYMNARGAALIAEHFPKTRLRLYVNITLRREIIYRGRVTKFITVKTPYIVHADEYVANMDYYNQIAVRYALSQLSMVISAGWGVEDVEVDARIVERVE